MKPRVRVETRVVNDPAGDLGVLLQFNHGWLVLPPHSARMLAAELLNRVDEIEDDLQR